MQYQPLFVMRIYTHYFKILRPTPRIQGLLSSYLHRYTGKILKKERGRWISEPGKLYAFRNKDRSEYRLHINTLTEFKKLLEANYITENLYDTEIVQLPLPHHVNIQIRDQWKARPDQIPAIDYITNDIETVRTKLLGLFTGAGKGFISMASIAKLGLRTLVMVKPQYIKKWYDELMSILKLNLGDIIVVQGGEHLEGLIAMAKEGTLTAKFIIISNRTYQNYIKAYETDEDGLDFLRYECHPDDFYEILKVSILLIDEVHQEFHANFKCFLFAHVLLSISLSATLLSHDSFMMRMYDAAFPVPTRFKGIEMKKYVNMYPVSYQFKEPGKIRLKEFGSDSYSHTAFEKSIMYRPWVQRSYFDMIKFIIDHGYIREYVNGDKCLVYAASIKMCTELTTYLRAKYPNKIVNRYVGEDPLEDLMEADIGVTTILSGGTALDIPNLRVLVNTINIDSAQSNIQTRGRLRELKGRDVKYFYTYCDQFPKHKEYHERRINLLRDTTLFIKDTPYSIQIG